MHGGSSSIPRQMDVASQMDSVPSADSGSYSPGGDCSGSASGDTSSRLVCHQNVGVHDVAVERIRRRRSAAPRRVRNHHGRQGRSRPCAAPRPPIVAARGGGARPAPRGRAAPQTFLRRRRRKRRASSRSRGSGLLKCRVHRLPPDSAVRPAAACRGDSGCARIPTKSQRHGGLLQGQFAVEHQVQDLALAQRQLHQGRAQGRAVSSCSAAVGGVTLG